MRLMKKSLFLLAAALLVLCSCASSAQTESGPKDPDPYFQQVIDALDPADLNDAISRATLLHNRGIAASGECAAEGHVIFDVEETDDRAVAYITAEYSEYVFANGIFTANDITTTQAKLTFSKDKAGNYTLVDYELPSDRGVEGIFSKNAMISWDVVDPDWYYTELRIQQEAYALGYLRQIGRTAPIQSDIETSAPGITDLMLAALQSEQPDYPTWIGTKEQVEDGVRYVYEMAFDETGPLSGVVIYWKYPFEGDEITEEHYYEVTENSAVKLEEYDYQSVGERALYEEHSHDGGLMDEEPDGETPDEEVPDDGQESA